MRVIFGLAAIGLALTACSLRASDSTSRDEAAATAAEASRHPVSGLPVIPLTVTHDGKRHAFRVELAKTREEQARGLMFRTAMGSDEGMIFPTDPPRPSSFWMKNTVLPLDIIFIGTDGRILNIAADTVPYSEQPIVSAGVTGGVLELNAGRAAELALAPGDKVEW